MLVTIINGDANKRTLATPFYFKQDKGYYKEYTMVDDEGNVNTVTITDNDKSYLQVNTRKLLSNDMVVVPFTHNLVKVIDAVEYSKVIDQAQIKLHQYLMRIQQFKTLHHENAH